MINHVISYRWFFIVLFLFSPLQADDSYLEPGSLRLSHALSLEGVLHQLRPGHTVQNLENGNKIYSMEGNSDRPWKAEWGQQILTEAAIRPSRSLFGRVLFEAQGEYADRFWRPVNINHDAKRNGDEVFFREAEARLDRANWYLHGFSGVARDDWGAQGDFFRLYPAAYPARDYLGSSSFFGVYPDNWRHNLYLDTFGRPVPRGAELGFEAYGTDGAVAYGDELSWGLDESIYARWGLPIGNSKMTLVVQDEDAPESIFDEDERNQAYALSWNKPIETGGQFEAGVLYNPYRVDEQYQIARIVPAGSGLLGSSVEISEKTSQADDAWAGRAHLEKGGTIFNKYLVWSLDYTRAEILAGNKEQVEAGLTSDFFRVFQGRVQYTYRRPIEGPIPFLFEGTPDNIGAVASSPRGPESPFTVNWSNREAVFVTTTLEFDPTPGTSLFLYDPTALALWNINPEEDSGAAFAVQYRMSDYRTATDRNYYTNINGEIVWEPAAHAGAPATDHPLHEARFLGRTNAGGWGLILGIAGGQMPAVLGIAEKALTEYISVEGKVIRHPFVFWGHYGTGLWGPEEYNHPFFGLAWDRLYGGGVSYNITRNTTWDVSVLVAREDDGLFSAPDLGSTNEIRTVFSHRFGFLFQFKGPSRRGFQAS